MFSATPIHKLSLTPNKTENPVSTPALLLNNCVILLQMNEISHLFKPV